VWLAARLSSADLAKVRKEAGVAAGAPVPRLKPPEFGGASALRFQTEAAFYEDLETRFFLDMSAYLKKTLGVKAPLIASATPAGGSPYAILNSIARLDIVDAHFYWQNGKPIKQPDGWQLKPAYSAMVNDPITLPSSRYHGRQWLVSHSLSTS
jgi:hypothetical protein